MKEFLKPTTIKVVLALVLLALGVFIDNATACPPYAECASPSVLGIIVSNLTLIPLAIYLFMSLSWGGVPAFVLLVILYYGFSCSLVHYYHKKIEN